MSKEKTNTKQGGGILAGLVLLIIGVCVLWYNEGRTVKTASAIKEAKKNYTDVSSEKIDKKYEGKLVATKGKIDLSEATELTDEKFGITAKAAKLERIVEMYQWEEKCETDDNKNKTCTYNKVWSDNLIDSSSFEKDGHTNPTTFPYESEEKIASNVKLGAYTLPEELIKLASYSKTKNNDDLTSEYQNKVEGIIVDGNYLTNVKEGNPEIGNIRISYKYLDSETVSVLAVQTGNTFEAFTSKKGKDIYKIVKGNRSGAQILESMTKSNNTLKWILRALGVILTIAGFGSMFSFINNIANKVPILGNIVSGATGLISFLLGISLSLIVIAIAWFRYRPILSIVLIIIVIVIMILLNPDFVDKIKKDKK